MWCPKCKMEYRKGITICADCGSELVEHDGEYGVNICEIKDETTADEIIEYLIYSGVEGVEKESNENTVGFKILVPEKAEKRAEKLIKGYLLGKEEEKEANVSAETTTTEETEVAEEIEANALKNEQVEDTGKLLHGSNKREYVKMADKYRDLKFSGITFIIFGILGTVYLALSKLEIIPIQYNTFIFYVISALFIGFLIAGIVSCVNSKKYKKFIQIEEEKTASIKKWLDEHLTKEMVDAWYDNNASTGENDLLISAHIRTMLVREYSKESEEYFEMLADEYYEEHFYEDVSDMEE